MFYHKTNFKFSESATDWILSRFQHRFDSTFYHDLDVGQYGPGIQEEWQQSVAGKELINFLKGFNLDIDYMGICVFISNLDRWYEGNPHIDMKFGPNGSESIKTRFNVMVLGNTNDKMVWWTSHNFDSTDLVINTFESLEGVKFTSKSIPGNDPKQRWEYLRVPSAEVTNLLEPSAFVKTDCAHTVNVSPGPRLIVTAGFRQSIEEIIPH